MSKFEELRRRLGINDTTHEFTKHTREKYFNKIKDNIPLACKRL